jgi:hypothetical protein
MREFIVWFTNENGQDEQQTVKALSRRDAQVKLFSLRPDVKIDSINEVQ